MHKIVVALAFLSVTCIAQPLRAQTVPVDTLTIYGEFNAPLMFIQEDQLTGILPDILEEVLTRAGSKKGRNAITLVPWPRGYAAVLQRPNILLFPMIRTPSREDLFHWVGPIISANTVIIAKKSRGIKIESANDLKKYVVGAIQFDMGAVALEEEGLTAEQIFYVSAPHNALQMLTHDRIDMWSYSKIVAYWLLQSHGQFLSDYEVVYTLREGSRYFAVSKQTKPEIIEALQKAVEEARSAGVFTEAIDRYLPEGTLSAK